MITYYKALQLDGTDFATGKTKPVLGEWMPEITNLVLCGSGYHLADSAAETLAGGSWPCKLFEAEAMGDPGYGSFTAYYPHKGVFRSYRLIRELPAWQALGPNGESVVAFIERVTKLTEPETKKLSVYIPHYLTLEKAYEASWYVARTLARYAALVEAKKALDDALPESASWGVRKAASLRLSSLVVNDGLTPKHYKALSGPWTSVIDVQ